MRWDEKAGFAVFNRLVPVMELPTLIEEAERLFSSHGRRPAGLRLVLERSSLFTNFAAGAIVREVIEPILGERAFIVRSLLFDKTPEANWDVPWHQDTTIAVEEKQETVGFGPWSVKDGVPHVRPPAAVLENMLTIRISLDDGGESNGPLLVAPGTHLDGIRSNEKTASFESTSVACVTEPGGAVLMRPLLFHASRRALHPAHRRVLHLEFAGKELPPPLRWARA